MRKFLILILVLLSSPLGLFAGRVFVTSAGWDADLKVYFTDKRYEADILVYVSSYGYEARGKDAIWHYVQHKYQAALDGRDRRRALGSLPGLGRVLD